MITLKEIDVTLAVSRTGSFMAASRKLGVSQGNVSKIIAGFEKKLGVQLFVRTCDGVTLTSAGEYVCMYAETMESFVHKIQDIAAEYAKYPEHAALDPKTA